MWVGMTLETILDLLLVNIITFLCILDHIPLQGSAPVLPQEFI